MPPIKTCPVPDTSYLARYHRSGAYTDCYVADVPRMVSQAQFIEAFYTSTLFRIERFILKLVLAKPSTDEQARQLSLGDSDSFAAWHVESRNGSELLLAFADTRSWLMATPESGYGNTATRLCFGSAIVPTINARTGERRWDLASTRCWAFTGSIRKRCYARRYRD